ncbi:MAG TPA: AMIN domain-containing protein, partial [Candidatus Binatia bacterium]|nr:AMIN domain-containing protein [Candidatus Binatia bacterium]
MLLVATVLLFLPCRLAPAIAAASEGAASNSGATRSKVLVTGVRSTSSDGYARITVELSQEAKFDVGRLLDNLAKGAAPRIYVDIYGAQLAVASKQPVQVDNDLVRQVRIGQYSADVVRVVLDLQNRTAHNAFMVADPYRLI